MRLPSPILSTGLILALAACEPAPPTRSPILSTDGTPIHFEVHGGGEPTLVFVHGWACDRTYWEAQVPHFTAKHQVVTLDLAGHGESGLGRAVWSMEAFGQDVAAVVEKLDLEEVVLIGHSMGGPVVMEAARQLGSRVVGVVGVDTFNDLTVRYSAEETRRFVQPFLSDFQGAVRGIVQGMFLPTADSTLANWVIRDMSSSDPTVGIGAFEGMVAWYTDESEQAFRELQVPIHLINADYHPTNVEAGQAIASSFDAVFMSGVGHFVMMEDPQTFNRLLESIVDSLMPSP